MTWRPGGPPKTVRRRARASWESSWGWKSCRADACSRGRAAPMTDCGHLPRAAVRAQGAAYSTLSQVGRDWVPDPVREAKVRCACSHAARLEQALSSPSWSDALACAWRLQFKANAKGPVPFKPIGGTKQRLSMCVPSLLAGGTAGGCRMGTGALRLDGQPPAACLMLPADWLFVTRACRWSPNPFCTEARPAKNEDFTLLD